MKRFFYLVFSVVLCLCLITSHGTKAEEETNANPGDDAFTYTHDPRENPEAMADIIENADAVYGFSPDPASQRLGSYAEFDWTDPEFV